VRADLQIHRALGPRTEFDDLVTGREPLNESEDEIAEEIAPAVLRRELDAVVERAAGDAGPGGAAVLIGVDRIHEAGIVAGPLAGGPAEIRAAASQVDLLPEVSSNVVDVDPAAARLHGEGEGVAQAERPYFAPRAGRPDKRVVGRNDIGEGGGIDPEQFSSEQRERLRIGRDLAVTDGD